MTAAEQPRSGSLSAGLLFGGAGILLYRTIALLAGSRAVLKRWVIAMTLVEMVLDVVTMASSARWWASRSALHARLAPRVGAAATLLHAGRVLVFVLGRTGPWVDFDVRPEHRVDHKERWSWAQVVFAGVLSVVGIVGVLVCWLAGRRSPARTRPAA